MSDTVGQEPDWLHHGYEHIWLPYEQMKTMPRPSAVARTDGERIYLTDGRVLIDGIGSWWTCVHGYNHPKILSAVSAQLEKMPHIMLGGLAHEQSYHLAARLAAMTPGDLTKTFFTESGSVAVEVAMKIAVQYWRNLSGAAKTKFISFRGGYHGDTFATMSVCDPEEGMHSLFAGALQGQYIADLPRDEDTLNQLETILKENDDIAAIVTEPLLQGAGGMLMHDGECLRAMRDLCDKYGALLIFDEIFTGFGRTGAMFAAQKAGVTPDIMTLGKALTGGVAPLAATIASAKVYAAFHDDDADKALMHGPTYTGHALGCAAANASLDLFHSELRLAQVAAIETQMKAAFEPLRNAPGVSDVRVIGAVGAVEMIDAFDVGAARAAFIEEGVFIRPLGKTMYLSPSYTISTEDLKALTDAIYRRVAHLG